MKNLKKQIQLNVDFLKLINKNKQNKSKKFKQNLKKARFKNLKTNVFVDIKFK